MLCSLISPWAKFSILQKYHLDYLNHIYIWQVRPQLSCGDIFQIYTWYSISNVCLTMLNNSENNGTEDIVLLTPTLGLWDSQDMGLLPDAQKLRVAHAHAPEMPGAISPPPTSKQTVISDPGMHHGTCVTHLPWCLSGSLIARWRGKGSRHSRRTHSTEFCVSSKRPVPDQTKLHVVSLILNENSFRTQRQS